MPRAARTKGSERNKKGEISRREQQKLDSRVGEDVAIAQQINRGRRKSARTVIPRPKLPLCRPFPVPLTLYRPSDQVSSFGIPLFFTPRTK